MHVSRRNDLCHRCGRTTGLQPPNLSFLFLIFRKHNFVALLFRIAVNSESDENRVFYDFTEGRGSCGPCNLDDTFPECNDRVFAAGHIGIASPAILPDISTRGLLGFRKVNYLSQRVVGNSFSLPSAAPPRARNYHRSPPRLIALEFTESGWKWR